MTSTLRRLLAAGALSASVTTVVAAGPVTADEATPTVECATATAQLATAQADAVAARKAFVASNKPMGRLIAAERAAVRAEVKTSRTTLRHLEGRLSTSHDQAARKALQAQIKTERADVRHGNRLLASKAALRAEVKADREAAKKAYAAARAAVTAAHVIAEAACADTAEPAESSTTV